MENCNPNYIIINRKSPSFAIYSIFTFNLMEHFNPNRSIAINRKGKAHYKGSES